jgi:hypothetical protein
VNQRIKALAEQAGFQYIKDEGIGWAGNHNASLPKFAELIIRECADVADENYIHRGSRTCGLAIRLHFGVEQ